MPLRYLTLQIHDKVPMIEKNMFLSKELINIFSIEAMIKYQ